MTSSSSEHHVRVAALHSIQQQQQQTRHLSQTLLLSPLVNFNDPATHPPQGILPMAVTTPSSSARPLLPGTTRASQRKMRPPSPSLWRTKEFLLYYLAYITIIPLMIYTMYQTSVPSRKEYHGYEHYLTDGWMLGRKVDLSDGQWRTFRSHLPAFTLAMFAYVAINWCFRLVVLRGFYSGFLKSPMSIRGALPTVWVAFAYASIFVTILSGSSILFILVLTGANYFVAKRFGGRRWAPLVIWAYNVGMLFSNECFKGYEFGRIHGSLAWLDNHRGILRRWDITFNITMLRMVSFAMDYHWRVRQEQVSSLQKIDSMVAGPKTDKDRIEHSCFKEDYCFVNYWAYILYPPLYLTGPIITFNNFISQMRYPPPSIKLRSTVLYGIRLVAAGLFMELILHTVYAVAISKWAHWDSFSAFEISLMGYMRLTFIWLKLFVIWRFARFWAMADNIDTVENMRRCMSNNYSLQQFWRDWHCSYNRWLVRYVYIPLGGKHTSTWNTFVIFTFVALWHDLTLRLLQWAWIIALLFLPEGLATWYFGKPQWSSKPYFRYLCSMGGALNIVGMMIANLVGFGDAGVEQMLEKIFSRHGAVFLPVTYLILNFHLQIMFELREHEYRKEYEASNRMRMAESGLELELAAAASSAASSQDTLGKSPQVTRDRSDMAVSFGSKAAEADTSNSSGSSPSIHSESLTKRSGGSSGGKRHDHND
ncbi:glycerol transporter [Coemansia sp. RSA 1286]|nr:glycerol transporter [Coemansia sp. RSA 1721]KAJ2637713.1 glycerol transporter [Coemansia sp. RSA 1286]